MAVYKAFVIGELLNIAMGKCKKIKKPPIQKCDPPYASPIMLVNGHEIFQPVRSMRYEKGSFLALPKS